LSGKIQDAGGIGGLLTITKRNNINTETYNVTYDANGNVSEYLGASNRISAHYEYSPFGNVIIMNGQEATIFAHRFSTKFIDQEYGLYYYGMRYYEPALGRWVNRDPIEEEGGNNIYAFINNKINDYDYLGLVNKKFPCGKCKVCVEDHGLGDKHLHVHWNCNPKAENCHGGGTASLPGWGPHGGGGGSHNWENAPDSVKDCVNKRMKYRYQSIELREEYNQQCCKQNKYTELVYDGLTYTSGCISVYATYKVLKICGGGTIGFLVGGGIPGATAGVLICVGTP